MDIALPDVNDPMSLVNALKWAYEQGGWGCLAALATIILIRVYRTDTVQTNPLLPMKAHWDSLPQWVKWSLSFLGAGLTGGIPVLIAGQGIWAFVIAVTTVGVGAILGHEGTKSVGKVMYKSATGKNPDYEPSTVRKMTTLIVPLPTLVDGKLPEPTAGTARLEGPSDHGPAT